MALAEPIGVVAAAVYLIFVFLFIPIPFYEWNTKAENEAYVFEK